MENNDNKKVVGKMKDEIQSLPIKEWIALNPKVYSHNHQNMQEQHAKIMNTLTNIEVEKGNPQAYNVISKNGDDAEEHKLIFKNKKILKGIPNAVVNNEITHQDYDKVHKDNIPIKRNVTSIRSFNHNVVTFRTEKIALTSYYDKMKMIDGNTCVPFGYNPA